MVLPQLAQPFKSVWQEYPRACELPIWSPAPGWPEALAVHILESSRALEGSIQCISRCSGRQGLRHRNAQKDLREHHLDTPGSAPDLSFGWKGSYSVLTAVTLHSAWLEQGVLTRATFGYRAKMQ